MSILVILISYEYDVRPVSISNLYYTSPRDLLLHPHYYDSYTRADSEQRCKHCNGYTDMHMYVDLMRTSVCSFLPQLISKSGEESSAKSWVRDRSSVDLKLGPDGP